MKEKKTVSSISFWNMIVVRERMLTWSDSNYKKNNNKLCASKKWEKYRMPSSKLLKILSYRHFLKLSYSIFLQLILPGVVTCGYCNKCHHLINHVTALLPHCTSNMAYNELQVLLYVNGKTRFTHTNKHTC